MAGFDLNPPAALMLGATALQAGGQIAGGRAQQIIGQRKRLMYQGEAAQLEQNAGQAFAASQRTAAANDLNTQLIASRALAVAAASGASATDPTVVNTIARIKEQGAYKSMLDLYAGEEQQRAMQYQASLDRTSGENAVSDADYAAKVSRYGAAATILSGAGTASLYSRYAGKGGAGMANASMWGSD